jgi:post-segregation antitoxin (ccd killing protein)
MRIAMARVNVYIPDDLAAAARELHLNLSALTQEAIRSRVSESSTDAWLMTLRHPISPGTGHEAVTAALDEIREAASTRHG